MEELKLLVLELMTRIQELETTVAKQQRELEVLRPLLLPGADKNKEANQAKIEKSVVKNTSKQAAQKTRRTFLTKLAKTGFLAVGMGLAAASIVEKEAQARILVNPTNYPLQFGAITTPPATTISGVLGDTNVRIGLAACGDPTLDYAKLPLFDTGVFAQGGGYGVYAITDKSMASAGYFRNIGTSGVGQYYAITAMSDKGTAITATGTGSGFGVIGSSSGIGSGVDGSSSSGPGVSAFSVSGAGVSATSSIGVPLHLQISNSTPTGGTRAKGDFYLDNLGKVYVWARNDANSTDMWRQVQFVPA